MGSTGIEDQQGRPVINLNMQQDCIPAAGEFKWNGKGAFGRRSRAGMDKEQKASQRAESKTACGLSRHLGFASGPAPWRNNPISSLSIGGGLATEHTRTIPKMQDIQKKLGKKIADLRKKRGFSQESFADECQFHRSYMGALERGEKNVTIAMLVRVTRALKISLSELFKGI
jgi:ribosome-binding protein aMBF1 (putative translation factor)